MKQVIVTTILAMSLALTFTNSSHAKDPSNHLQDIQGIKHLRTKGPLLKQSFQVELMAIDGNSLLLIRDSQTVPVRALGYGSGQFKWEMDGLTYEITNYPWNNNHKPVSGLISNAKGKTQKFMLYSKKTLKAAKGQSSARGRWVGELAFPGGAMLDFNVQISDVSWSFENCSDGAAYMHVSYSGAPSQPASLMHCSDLAPHGDYYASFFHWDNISGEVFFITINGDITPKGDILQGQSSIFSLTNGTSSEGKFLLFRHQPFSL